MKQRKRRISILLSMLLLLSVFQPAVALDADPDFEQIYEIGTRLLGDIEHEKELYGLADVNFDNLYIGEYIPAYIAKETGLTLSSTRYYPILENGEWVGTLTCNKSNGIWNAQLSNTFVEELPEIGSNDDLKLVFDSNAGYLFKNSTIHSIASYNAVTERVDIASSPMTLSAADGQKLVNKRAVEIGKFDSSVQSRSSLPTQKFLNVPLVTKWVNGQYTNGCWAATAKAIGDYYGEQTATTLDDIYEYAGIEKYEYGPNVLGDTETVLSGYYGFSCSRYGSTDFSFSNMQSSLAAGKPIAGQVYLTSRYFFHAVAIRGYSRYTNSSTYAGSFSYVENEYQYPRYVAVSVSLYQEAACEYDYYYEDATEGMFNAFSVVTNP